MVDSNLLDERADSDYERDSGDNKVEEEKNPHVLWKVSVWILRSHCVETLKSENTNVGECQ